MGSRDQLSACNDIQVAIPRKVFPIVSKVSWQALQYMLKCEPFLRKGATHLAVDGLMEHQVQWIHIEAYPCLHCLRPRPTISVLTPAEHELYNRGMRIYALTLIVHLLLYSCVSTRVFTCRYTYVTAGADGVQS